MVAMSLMQAVVVVVVGAVAGHLACKVSGTPNIHCTILTIDINKRQIQSNIASTKYLYLRLFASSIPSVESNDPIVHVILFISLIISSYRSMHAHLASMATHIKRLHTCTVRSCPKVCFPSFLSFRLR